MSTPTTPAVAPADRLLDDDLVELERERPVEAEDEPGLDRVLEGRPVHAADGGGDDVVEVLLAAAVSLHRVEAQLHRRDVVLAVGPADDLVDRALDRERRALDELGPVEQLEVAVERPVPPRRDRDHVPELPVVLGRELDALRVGDPPHDRRGHGAAEVAVELRERDLARQGTRHGRRIAEARRRPRRDQERATAARAELDVPGGRVQSAAIRPADRDRVDARRQRLAVGSGEDDVGRPARCSRSRRVPGGTGTSGLGASRRRTASCTDAWAVSITPRPVARGRKTVATIGAWPAVRRIVRRRPGIGLVERPVGAPRRARRRARRPSRTARSGPPTGRLSDGATRSVCGRPAAAPAAGRRHGRPRGGGSSRSTRSPCRTSTRYGARPPDAFGAVGRQNEESAGRSAAPGIRADAIHSSSPPGRTSQIRASDGASPAREGQAQDEDGQVAGREGDVRLSRRSSEPRPTSARRARPGPIRPGRRHVGAERPTTPTRHGLRGRGVDHGPGAAGRSDEPAVGRGRRRDGRSRGRSREVAASGRRWRRWLAVGPAASHGLIDGDRERDDDDHRERRPRARSVVDAPPTPDGFEFDAHPTIVARVRDHRRSTWAGASGRCDAARFDDKPATAT